MQKDEHTKILMNAQDLDVRIMTTALDGVTVVPVSTQVQIASGIPAFNIVGLPDKAVSESRERVRAALYSLGLGLPAKRILINLSPADLPKEGSHYDLPIALGLLVAMDILDLEALSECLAFGELSLDGRLQAVPGVLPTAIEANASQKCLVCPYDSAAEARLSGLKNILAAHHLQDLISHWRDGHILPEPQDLPEQSGVKQTGMWQAVRGQEGAKRGIEIAAAGAHAVMLNGPPGVGKSLLARALPEILPPLTSQEALQTTLIRNIIGETITQESMSSRPFRDPHHSASMVALIGGGPKAQPGEITLAHNGVLFLDELPEYSRATLEALRQPLETGYAVISRANRRTTYPSRFQLVAAMNPCRCGYFGNAQRMCNKAPDCALSYQNRISGPLWDRIDLYLEVPDVPLKHLLKSKDVATDEVERVAAGVRRARLLQSERYDQVGTTNASASAEAIQDVVKKTLDQDADTLLLEAAETISFSARGWYRMIRVARTIADLAGSESVQRKHMAEALTFRRILP